MNLKGFKENKAKNSFFSKENSIYYIILFGALLKLLMFIKRPDLWWDSAEYIGISKYIWTFGEFGFWNPVRPLVLPMILGFFWKIGLDPILFGRLLQILFASISVYLIYAVSKRMLNDERIALLAAFFLAVDPIIYNNTQHLLTSTIAMTFSLFAVNYYLKAHASKFNNKFLMLSGAFAGLAFLSRLTFIFIGLSIGLSLISTSKIRKIKDKVIKAAYFSIAFFMVWSPYLILNIILYKNPLYPYVRGIYEINLAGGALTYPLTYYVQSIPKVASITIVGLVGLYFLFRNFKKDENKLLLLLFFSGFLYHMFLVEVKVLRYAILFLPFLYIISSYGVIELSKKDNLLRNLMVLLILFSLFQTFIAGTNEGYSYSILAFVKHSQTENQYYLENNFYNYLDKPEYKGAVLLSSSPHPLAFSDVRFNSFYFPNIMKLKEFEDKGEPFFVMVSMADNYCDPTLEFCKKQQAESNEAYDRIFLNYEKIHDVDIGGNTYYVFKYG